MRLDNNIFRFGDLNAKNRLGVPADYRGDVFNKNNNNNT